MANQENDPRSRLTPGDGGFYTDSMSAGETGEQPSGQPQEPSKRARVMINRVTPTEQVEYRPRRFTQEDQINAVRNDPELRAAAARNINPTNITEVLAQGFEAGENAENRDENNDMRLSRIIASAVSQAVGQELGRILNPSQAREDTPPQPQTDETEIQNEQADPRTLAEKVDDERNERRLRARERNRASYADEIDELFDLVLSPEQEMDEKQERRKRVGAQQIKRKVQTVLSNYNVTDNQGRRRLQLLPETFRALSEFAEIDIQDTSIDEILNESQKLYNTVDVGKFFEEIPAPTEMTVPQSDEQLLDRLVHSDLSGQEEAFSIYGESPIFDVFKEENGKYGRFEPVNFIRFLQTQASVLRGDAFKTSNPYSLLREFSFVIGNRQFPIAHIYNPSEYYGDQEIILRGGELSDQDKSQGRRENFRGSVEYVRRFELRALLNRFLWGDEKWAGIADARRKIGGGEAPAILNNNDMTVEGDKPEDIGNPGWVALANIPISSEYRENLDYGSGGIILRRGFDFYMYISSLTADKNTTFPTEIVNGREVPVRLGRKAFGLIRGESREEKARQKSTEQYGPGVYAFYEALMAGVISSIPELKLKYFQRVVNAVRNIPTDFRDSFESIEEVNSVVDDILLEKREKHTPPGDEASLSVHARMRNRANALPKIDIRMNTWVKEVVDRLETEGLLVQGLSGDQLARVVQDELMISFFDEDVHAYCEKQVANLSVGKQKTRLSKPDVELGRTHSYIDGEIDGQDQAYRTALVNLTGDNYLKIFKSPNDIDEFTEQIAFAAVGVRGYQRGDMNPFSVPDKDPAIRSLMHDAGMEGLFAAAEADGIRLASSDKKRLSGILYDLVLPVPYGIWAEGDVVAMNPGKELHVDASIVARQLDGRQVMAMPNYPGIRAILLPYFDYLRLSPVGENNFAITLREYLQGGEGMDVNPWKYGKGYFFQENVESVYARDIFTRAGELYSNLIEGFPDLEEIVQSGVGMTEAGTGGGYSIVSFSKAAEVMKKTMGLMNGLYNTRLPALIRDKHVYSLRVKYKTEERGKEKVGRKQQQYVEGTILDRMLSPEVLAVRSIISRTGEPEKESLSRAVFAYMIRKTAEHKGYLLNEGSRETYIHAVTTAASRIPLGGIQEDTDYGGEIRRVSAVVLTQHEIEGILDNDLIRQEIQKITSGGSIASTSNVGQRRGWFRR